MSTIYADASKYVVAQLRKLRLTKEVREELIKKYGMENLLLKGGSVKGLLVVSFYEDYSELSERFSPCTTICKTA